MKAPAVPSSCASMTADRSSAGGSSMSPRLPREALGFSGLAHGDARGARQRLNQGLSQGRPGQFQPEFRPRAAAFLRRRRAKRHSGGLRPPAFALWRRPAVNHDVRTRETIVIHHVAAARGMFKLGHDADRASSGLRAAPSFYKIDDQARSVLAETWPLIAPHLDRAIDDFVERWLTLPHIASRCQATTKT